MVQIITDSSALILLAKCNLLEIFCNLFKIVIPSSVAEEVASEKLVKSYPGAALISNLIAEGKIQLGNPQATNFNFPHTLHRGEKDVLLLGLELNGSIIATDDGKAIKAAKFLKIPFIITPRIVTYLFKLKEISFEKARQSIDRLGKIGRYSPEIIAEAVLSLMEARDEQTHDNTDT